MLEHAWPRGEFGEHSWYDEERLTWANIGLSGEKYLDLDDFSPYLNATGTKVLTLDDWIETISFVAETTGYEDHEIKRSPGEDSTGINAQRDQYAVEINSDGNVFSLKNQNLCTLVSHLLLKQCTIRNGNSQ